jgi:hypothetical protein
LRATTIQSERQQLSQALWNAFGEPRPEEPVATDAIAATDVPAAGEATAG